MKKYVSKAAWGIMLSSLYSSGSQPVCRERFPGMPHSFLEFWKIC